MALRCLKIFRRSTFIIRSNILSTSSVVHKEIRVHKPKEYKTEDNYIYLEDPDSFGSLSGNINKPDTLDDESDIKEEEFISKLPLPSQKLTTKQYADLIKQYIKHKRVKEAIDILEERMLKQDRVKAENYIYNILIGACAKVGYTKKAFKLYNDMKRRALKPTGDTYTCLFEACTNSPWLEDGLKRAHNLRNLMIEKGIEPNLTIYNCMIKAFGRCGDLPTAFKIVDEMVSKKIKIRVHTFNHLLQACITDKSSGLRHALVVWRKMLKVREKPNIYSFNLMLKCVKDCNLGTKEDIKELIETIESHIAISNRNIIKPLQIESLETTFPINSHDITSEVNKKEITKCLETIKSNSDDELIRTEISDKNLVITENNLLQIVDRPKINTKSVRVVPNLLSNNLQIEQVLSLKEVSSAQEKFAVIGGQEDFLKELEVYNIKPDIKIFTQMISLIDNTREAELQLLESIKASEIHPDIDFYNLLIKKRCLRSDYEGAMEIKEIIKKDSKQRKRKKKLQLNFNVMTYGVLAMASQSEESAVQLLTEMKENYIQANPEILGTLLRHGTAHCKFSYVLYIMNYVKAENIKVNNVFLKHLEDFSEKCSMIIDQRKASKIFSNSYNIFSRVYADWLKDINVEEILQNEHPWKQFQDIHPPSFQRTNITIREPRKFYKNHRKYVPYAPLK